MYKRTAAAVDTRMTYAVGRIVFKEEQIALLQIADRRNITPGTHGGEAGSAVAARADAAGAKAEVHKPRAVEALGGTFLAPDVRITEHCGCNGNQPVRAVGRGIGRRAVRGRRIVRTRR